MSKIFDEEASDRVVCLVEDRISVQECSIVSVCEQMAPKLGVSASALRQWLQKSRWENRDRGDQIDLVAEDVNGSYKNEIIHARWWVDVLGVEIATFEWVSWWNVKRVYRALDYHTPQEVENRYW
ncbi:MAG: hypothetical protein SPI12_03600 [Actinomycetaceae bacterium]|nr:phage terminase small subunit-related protein [Actinomycetaceae bacterium]MDY6082931.1 hypothetical protein [Actinomycetaceae bacterium]